MVKGGNMNHFKITIVGETPLNDEQIGKCLDAIHDYVEYVLRGECGITIKPKKPIYLNPVTDKKVIERMEKALSDTSKRDEALRRYQQARSYSLTDGNNMAKEKPSIQGGDDDG